MKRRLRDRWNEWLGPLPEYGIDDMMTCHIHRVLALYLTGIGLGIICGVTATLMWIYL